MSRVCAYRRSREPPCRDACGWKREMGQAALIPTELFSPCNLSTANRTQACLRGLRPGDYTILAWESVDGEAFYNPEFLKLYEGRGSALRVSEGDRKNVQLEAIAESAESE